MGNGVDKGKDGGAAAPAESKTFGRTVPDLISQHWKGIAALSVVLVAATITLAVIGLLDVSYDKGALSVRLGRPTKPSEPNGAYVETWYGFYGDWDKEKKTYIATDTLDVTFDPSSRMLRAQVKGLVRIKDEEKIRSWTRSGYYNDSGIALTYVTVSQSGTGTGAYFLQPVPGDDYVGLVIFQENFHGATLVCPYAASKKPMTVEAAKKRRPAMLQQECTELRVRG